MPGFNTYQMTRQAEDVQDEIYDISPVDNPIASMSATIQARAKLHEWSQDELAGIKKNATVEGAPAGNDTSSPLEELDNYCQIFTEVAEVTGTGRDVDTYGRDDEMVYQLEKRYKEMARDEESAIAGDAGGTGRQTKTAGNGSTAREMASIYEQVDAGNQTDASGATTIDDLETLLLSTHLACYNAGANPTYAVTTPAIAGYFAGFALSAGRNRDVEDTTLINVVDLYQSTYGRVDVVLDRSMVQATDDAIILFDPMYAATPVLRPTFDFEVAKLGDSDKREIVRESTFAVLNTKAHGIVDAVPANLTA